MQIWKCDRCPLMPLPNQHPNINNNTYMYVLCIKYGTYQDCLIMVNDGILCEGFILLLMKPNQYQETIFKSLFFICATSAIQEAKDLKIMETTTIQRFQVLAHSKWLPTNFISSQLHFFKWLPNCALSLLWKVMSICSVELYHPR